MDNNTRDSKNRPWLRRNVKKLAAFLFWVAVLIGYQVYIKSRWINRNPGDASSFLD